MTASPFDHPILSGLLGDEEVATHLSAEADLVAMSRFEAALARAQARSGLIPKMAADAIAAALEAHEPDMAVLKAGTLRDGVIVPEWVNQVRALLADSDKPHFHFGATSQDVIDTSLVLRLRPLLEIHEARIMALRDALEALGRQSGANRLMARTRMQDALEIEASSRIADWLMPLERHLARLEQLRPRLLVLQIGGAVGDRDKFGEHGNDIARDMAHDLDLVTPNKSWHSQRDGMFELASWMANVTGSLGKMGQDVALMALAGPDHIKLKGGGGSSAMPHKVNPVGAEVLVSLARYNATLVAGMGQSLVHEQERSGAAWTLEWLILPQMLMTTGSALITAQTLVDAIEKMGR